MHIERHRGVTVAELGFDAVDEIYSLRTALERLAAEWLCRNATEEDFKRMAAVLREFDKLPQPPTRSQVAGLDVAFHDALFQAAHHERLYQAWLALRSQIFLYLVHRGALRPDFAKTWLKDHEDFLEVLMRRQRTQVMKTVEAHIEGTYQRLLQANRDGELAARTQATLLALAFPAGATGAPRSQAPPDLRRPDLRRPQISGAPRSQMFR